MTDTSTAPTQRTTATNLAGPWLWLGRGLWLLMFAVCITLLINGVSIIQPVQSHIQQNNPPGFITFLASIPLYRRFLLVVVFYSVSVFLFWQRAEDRAALLVACMFLGFGSIPLASGIFSLTVGVMTLSPLLNYLSVAVYAMTIVVGYLVILMFPDGRFVPRWAIWLTLPSILVALAYAVVFSRERNVPLPLFGAISGLVLLGAVLQVLRYRQVATISQRQQIKWFVLGVVGFILLQAIGITTQTGLRPVTTLQDHLVFTLADLLLLASYLAPLIAIMLAVIRLRLFDINYVINRSIVYAAVSALLALVFAAAFFGVQAIIEGITGGDQSTLSAGVAGVLVAMLFHPTRVRVRRWVDRHLYGIEVDYTLAARQQAQLVSRPATHPADSTFGDYGRLDLIARGGMGEVYRAQHPHLGRPVAIKLLRDGSSSDPAARKRFIREARTIARMEHPNIVTLHEVGEMGETLYMVMEYLEGETLSGLLRTNGALTLEQARPLLVDLAAALDYAHAAGIIHRDIKPSNVIIENAPNRRAVLMDFGIAKISDLSQITQTGMMGTLDYIAPEQIQGAAGVDSRADVYSLGVMTYQMLTGETPFKHGNAGALVLAHLMQPPPDAREKAPDLPRAAAAALQQAMSKKPEERYATAGDFVRALG